MKIYYTLATIQNGEYFYRNGKKYLRVCALGGNMIHVLDPDSLGLRMRNNYKVKPIMSAKAQEVWWVNYRLLKLHRCTLPLSKIGNYENERKENDPCANI